MDSIHRLEEIFTHFPGIGPRQAKRFVHYLQGKSPSSIKEFVQLIEEVKKTTQECTQCHRFFARTNNTVTSSTLKLASLCSICADPNRDRSTLMIVARDSDFESVEKSGAYRGLYFILGGVVPILDKEPERKIRLNPLLDHLNSSTFAEIILSLNTTSDGEHTTSVIKEALQKLFGENKTKSNSSSPKITILGRGLSTGAELEYADGETIRNALTNRK